MVNFRRSLNFSRGVMVACLLVFSAGVAAEFVDQKSVLLGVNVAKVEVDVAGVELAMKGLTQQLAALTQIIDVASTSANTLSQEEREQILQSIQKLNANADAVSVILQGLPKQIDDFNHQLPEVIKATQAPLESVQESLLLLNNTASRLNTDFPGLISHSQQAFHASVDTFLTRVVMVAGLLLLFIFILVGISLWLLNKRVIQPVGAMVEVASQFPQQQQKTAELLDSAIDKLSVLEERDSNNANAQSEELNQETDDKQASLP